jgi:prevent-host-death family protein
MPKEVRIPVTVLRRAGAEYVDRVYYKKERIIITNRGKDVAVLVPTDDPAATKTNKASND